MSKVQLAGNASGTGIFTIASPNSNTDRTLTLPDNTGTVVTTGSTGVVTGSMIANSAVSALQLAGSAVGYPQLLSTDWTNSKAAAGYQKLPSGVIMQWGSVTSNTSTVTVTFPLAFPTACASVTATANDTPAVGVYVAINALGTTSFNSAVNTGGARTVWWVAFGY